MSEEAGRYVVESDSGIRYGARLRGADPAYLEPTPGEIREVLRMAGLTGAKAGELIGVNGRTIRKYCGGERSIPYSAWRLLLIETGLAIEARESRDAADLG